ncbi:sulfotransferase family protein [Marinobacter sp. JSM 1782161]|uniref:sulfotransferase family protein n=1 Tax=Marinobacter sp. JSM 1782161 TaxID=2685906 RepID=UPI0014033410|nr:sulfotransferase [Marinobacter sp. JSM 1782161]
MQPVFIVGCPRSGTTLVQSLIGTSREIYTPPETHFFSGIRFLRKPNPSVFDIIVSNVIGNLSFKKATGRYTGFFADETSACEKLHSTLSRIALSNGKSQYAEKTPAHLHAIKLIQSKLENAKFVFVTRSALGTAASYQKAAKNWRKSGDETDIIGSFGRWVRDTSIAQERCKEVNGIIVDYDRLVSSKTRHDEIEKIESYLGITLSLDNDAIKESAKRVVHKWESWKLNNLNNSSINAAQPNLSDEDISTLKNAINNLQKRLSDEKKR